MAFTLEGYWIQAIFVPAFDGPNSASGATPRLLPGFDVRSYGVLNFLNENDDNTFAEFLITEYIQNGGGQFPNSTAIVAGPGVTQVFCGAWANNADTEYLFVTDFFAT